MFSLAASEAGSDVGSSIPSPWQPLAPTVASAPPPTSSTKLSRKQRGSKPVAFRKQPQKIRDELCFAMKPPANIVAFRRKVRNLKRRQRQPFTSILVGALLMRFRIEGKAVKIRPPRRPIEMDRIKKASRLETTITHLASLARKNGISVTIGAWKSGGGVSAPPVVAPPTKKFFNNSSNVTKIKSELCPVTETCTAATMPAATPSLASSTPPKQHKVKAEKTVSLTTATHLSSSGVTPNSAKTLPITPTIARIKREGHASNPHSELSLISPDMQRVKVEIGHSPFNYHRSAEMPRLPTSPVPHPLDIREGHFISPRKRSLLRDFENGSPSLKRHRLSTDSRGSSSEGGGAGSPASSLAAAASPPRHNNGGGRVSSFSIDSIMSGSSNNSTVHRPVPIPASPAHLRATPSKSPARSLSPVSSANTPLVVPITPYQSRNASATPIHPGLAHLAGVAANPQLGLSPTPFSPAMAAVMMNNYYYNIAANAQIQQMLSSAMGATPTHTSVTTSHIPSTNGRSSVSRQSSGSPNTNPAATPTRPFSPWSLQYRGEPKVATPTGKTELKTKVPLSSESEGNFLFCLSSIKYLL